MLYDCRTILFRSYTPPPFKKSDYGHRHVQASDRLGRQAPPAAAAGAAAALPKSTAVDGSGGKGRRHHQRWPDNFRDGDQILRNLEAVYEAGLVPKKAYERKKLQLLALKI